MGIWSQSGRTYLANLPTSFDLVFCFHVMRGVSGNDTLDMAMSSQYLQF